MSENTETNNTEIFIDGAAMPAGGLTVTVKTDKPEKPLTDKEKLLKFISQILDLLTFKLVGLLALLTLVMLTMWTTYEQRAVIFSSIYNKYIFAEDYDTWSLSEKSIEKLKSLTNNENVGAVVVTDVILRQNLRSAKYYYVKDPELRKQILAIDQKYMGAGPLFTKNQQNTVRVLGILNREFSCVATSQTVYAKTPLLSDNFPYMCSLSIPNGPGEFVGYVSVGLTKIVSEDELTGIKLEMARIINDVYFRDVVKVSNFIPKDRRPD